MVWKVVSVEDEPEIAELIRLVLDHPQIEIQTADTGPEGLALVKAQKPDLVTLDVMLPGMNGWDIYDAIRADDELKLIPIIMLSVTSVRTERRQAFLGSRINLYVTKPFDIVQLRREVAGMLGSKDLWTPPKPPVACMFDAPDQEETLQSLSPDARTTAELITAASIPTGQPPLPDPANYPVHPAILHDADRLDADRQQQSQVRRRRATAGTRLRPNVLRARRHH
ncbi:MAG: response regulator [Anaerolineae bacterium]|nr:response regulator [Anaerolineae bacterium]